MTKDKLKADIEHHLDGIRVQWHDVTRQTDPKIARAKQEGVIATMNMVGDLKREYAQMCDQS